MPGPPKSDKQKEPADNKKQGPHGPTDSPPAGGGGSGGSGRHQVDDHQPGRKPTPEELKFLKARYHELNVENIRITDGLNAKYNCMSHTLEVYGEKIWPGVSGSPTSAQKLEAEYKRRGMVLRRAKKGEPVETGDIAVWGTNENVVRHVAKVVEGGNMESKLGPDYRFIHTQADLKGGVYGRVLYYLKRTPAAPSGPYNRKQDQMNVKSVREAESGAGSTELPKSTREVSAIEKLLQSARDGGHQISIDGMPARNATPVLPRKLVALLKRVVKDSLIDSQHRKQNWANPLTNPAKVGFPSDYWVHFSIDIDTAAGDVSYPEWIRCSDPECPENKFNDH